MVIKTSLFIVFVTLVQEQLVVDPKADDDFAGALIEDAVALDHVVVEDALEHLAVGELDVPLAVLGVALELPLVVRPLVPQLRKVLVVELPVERHRLRVVHPALPVELVVVPVPLVRYPPVLIVQLPETVHLIVLPLALVVPPVLEVQNPVPVLLVVALVALVAPPIRNILFDELQLELFTIALVEQGQMGEARTAGKALSVPGARKIGNEGSAHNWTTVSCVVDSGC